MRGSEGRSREPVYPSDHRKKLSLWIGSAFLISIHLQEKSPIVLSEGKIILADGQVIKTEMTKKQREILEALKIRA